jgi:hypothetical protein
VDVADVIRAAAARYGQDPTPWLKVAHIESGGNPTAHNASGASGLFQFMPKTWAQYGRGDINDPVANTDAAMRLARDNSARFQSTFGRAPTPGEVYLMHQQGAEGATKLLQNPTAPAASLIGAPAVTQNGGNANMTAGDFAKLWSSKFDGSAPPTQMASAVPTSTQSTSPQPPSPLRSAFAALAPSQQPQQPAQNTTQVLVGGRPQIADPAYLS